MPVSGATLFARFAYPPNALGYCGPDDAAVLLTDGGPESDERIARHARGFEGAWPYLEIIAAAAAITDPLDPRVVEAYWIGNELTDAVDPAALPELLRPRFGHQSGATWVPGGPHHSYHVFAVYPWVGLLGRATGHDVALSVLDQCRIRTGEVLAVDGAQVVVRSQPLVLRDGRLELGPAREQVAAWPMEGRGLLPEVAVGDDVALHWDWVCDQLDHGRLEQLTARNAEQLERTNAARPVGA